jgi:hypothetical protein
LDIRVFLRLAHHDEEVGSCQHDAGRHGELDQRGDAAARGLHDPGDRHSSGRQKHRNQPLHDAVEDQPHHTGLQQRLDAAPDCLGTENALQAAEQFEVFEVELEFLHVHAALQRGPGEDHDEHHNQHGSDDPGNGGKPVLQCLHGLARFRCGNDAADAEELVRGGIGGPFDGGRNHDGSGADADPRGEVLGTGKLALGTDLLHPFVGGFLGFFL